MTENSSSKKLRLTEFLSPVEDLIDPCNDRKEEIKKAALILSYTYLRNMMDGPVNIVAENLCMRCIRGTLGDGENHVEFSQHVYKFMDEIIKRGANEVKKDLEKETGEFILDRNVDNLNEYYPSQCEPVVYEE